MRFLVFLFLTICYIPSAAALELSAGWSVCFAPSAAPPVVRTAAQVLAEEVERRSRFLLPVEESLACRADSVQLRIQESGGALPAEGFRVETAGRGIRITGADGRGVLFGVGWLLRQANYRTGSLLLPDRLAVTSSPAYPIRGHQLGYRNRANSWDAWTYEQYERYIRELAVFGANSIENIPFEDTTQAPLMRYSREEMNLFLSQVCDRYAMDYWVWTPAEFDLAKKDLRDKEVEKHTAFYRQCRRLNGIFFPGGDPGSNHPRDVFPFLAELAPHLKRYHPRAKIWVSLQGFEKEAVSYSLDWIRKNQPDWLGGLVNGPSSPSIQEERAALPGKYGVRSYPDITHTVRCQFPVPWWDPAFALTQGRETINPRPVQSALLHNAFAPYTVGFLSYSDGVHDDVNKAVWSQAAWNPGRDVREILVEYARFFFQEDVAEEAADGILALEKNWEGPLALNGSVPATLRLWQDLERRAPQLRSSWRWQMCLVRAYYDAHLQARLRFERRQEERANEILLRAGSGISAGEAMQSALAALRLPHPDPAVAQWGARIAALYEDLFQSIQLQSSVPRYKASGYERGCSLDFLDYPMNNRWWLEDQFQALAPGMEEKEKVSRLHRLARWEDPGPGGFYDQLGHIGYSPHVRRGEGLNTDPNMERNPNPGYWWWDNGRSRQRLSFLTTMDWPLALVYEALDPQASYALRLTGYGQALVRADGRLLKPGLYGKEIGEIKEFPVPADLTADGKLVITFDKPTDEGQLNWRKQSRVAEAWLVKP